MPARRRPPDDPPPEIDFADEDPGPEPRIVTRPVEDARPLPIEIGLSIVEWPFRFIGGLLSSDDSEEVSEDEPSR